LAGTHVKVFIVLVLTMALAGCLTGNVSMKSAKYGGLNSKSIRKIPGHHLIVTNPEGFKIKITFRQNDCIPTFDNDKSFKDALQRMTESAFRRVFVDSEIRVEGDKAIELGEQFNSVSKIRLSSFIGTIEPERVFSLIGGGYRFSAILSGRATIADEAGIIIEKELSSARDTIIDLTLIPKKYKRNCVQFTANKIAEMLTGAISDVLTELVRDIEAQRARFLAISG